jgi:DNA-binding GntR family transcriptional regulator
MPGPWFSIAVDTATLYFKFVGSTEADFVKSAQKREPRGFSRVAATRTSQGLRALTGARGSQGPRAYEHVKSELLRGRFRPNEMLSVDDLASEVGVSRQPLLEAMRRLAAERLVEIIPQVGCRVATHSVQEIGDFFQLFATVEGLLAQLAAERHEPRELRRLRSVSGEIGALRSPKVDVDERSEGYRTLNREFHGLIHEMARAPEIAAFAQSCWDRSDFHLTSSSSLRLFAERLNEAQDEHEALITVISARKAQLAAVTMTEHILSFRAQLLAALTRNTPRPVEQRP